MIWIIFLALILMVLALLVGPLLRPRKLAVNRADYDLTVYRDQLREVDADVERGLLTTAQAEAARTEIKRRMLAAADKPEGEAAAGKSYKALAAALVVLVPAGALALYALLGNPTLPDMPFASRPDKSAHEQMAEIGAMVDRLAERLKQTPEDVEGWTMLARSARAMERFDLAAEAYRRLIALGQKDAANYASLGESLLFLAEGVSPDAVAAFQEALRIDPAEVRSRFYLGMARFEQGDAEGAIAIWNDLVTSAPPGAEWVAGVRARIDDAARSAGLDPAKIAARSPVGSGSVPMPAGGAPGGDTQAMINAMIDGLAAKLKDNPGDADGWKRLGRAYRVQQKLDLAKDAYGKAMALLPKDVEVKMAYADVLLALTPEGAKTVPADFVAVMRDVLLLDPVNADALYYVGLAEAQAGRVSTAKEMWGKLLATLPQGSPERAGLQKQIDELGG